MNSSLCPGLIIIFSRKVPEASISAAQDILSSLNSSVDPSEESLAIAKLQQRSETNLRNYETLISNIIGILESGTLYVSKVTPIHVKKTMEFFLQTLASYSNWTQHALLANPAGCAFSL